MMPENPESVAAAITPGSVVFYRGRDTYTVADVTEVFTSAYGDLTARLVDQVTGREYTAAVDWLTHRPDFDVTHDHADDCTSDENCDHPTHYNGCPMQHNDGS